MKEKRKIVTSLKVVIAGVCVCVCDDDDRKRRMSWRVGMV